MGLFWVGCRIEQGVARGLDFGVDLWGLGLEQGWFHGVRLGFGLGLGFGRRLRDKCCLERLSWAARSLRSFRRIGLCRMGFGTEERRKSRGKGLCLVPWVLEVR
jgi:hypothetical protein